MTVKLPLYGPTVDRETFHAAALAVRPLAIHGCTDLSNKLGYLAEVRPSALSADVVASTIALCTSVMVELAIQADPSRYVMGDECGFGVNADLISDLVESRRRTRAIVGAAREQLKEMVGTLQTV